MAGLEYPHTHNSWGQGLLTLPTPGSTENMDLLKIYPAGPGPVKLAGLEYPHTHNSSDQGLLTLPTLGSTENMERMKQTKWLGNLLWHSVLTNLKLGGLDVLKFVLLTQFSGTIKLAN